MVKALKGLSNLYFVIMIPLLFTFVMFSIFHDIGSIDSYNSIYPIFTGAIFSLIVIIFTGPLFINLFWAEYSANYSWTSGAIGFAIASFVWNFILPLLRWFGLLDSFFKVYGWTGSKLWWLLGLVRDLIFGHINTLNPWLTLVINLFVICAVILLSIINMSKGNTFQYIKDVIKSYTSWINNIWDTDIENTPQIILPKVLDGDNAYTKWLIWFLFFSLLIIVPIILGQRVRLLDGLLSNGYFNFFNIILILFFMGGGYWAYLRDIGLEWKYCDGDKDDKRTKWKTAIHKFGFYTLWLYLLFILLRITNVLQLEGADFRNLKVPIGFTFLIISLCGIGYWMMVNKGDDGWEPCANKKGKKAENRIHIFIGGFPFWYLTSWGLALFIRWCYRVIVARDLDIHTLGILPTLNGLMRTAMLIVATILGGIPYWLGESSFGKL